MISIESKSWIKETDDLFDFEAKNLKKSNFTISNEAKYSFLTTTNDNITLSKLSDLDKITPEQKIIAEISFNKNTHSFNITNPFSSENLHQYFEKKSCERPWTIVSQKDITELSEGDIIKLGRVRLKFSKIHILNFSQINNNNTNVNNNFNSNNHNFNSSQQIIKYANNNTTSITCSNNIQNNDQINSSANKDQKFYCRICYRSESDLSDPLLSPCKCTGSMGYIHFKCLKSCIESKIQKREDENCITYMWKNYNCEICLYPYPKYIKFKNYTYNLVNVDSSKFTEYAIVDYCLFEDSKKKTFHKGVMIFSLDNKDDITIGRTQTNKIRLKDISVSRKHCILKKIGGRLCVSDLSSKFGTLFYLKNSFEMKNKKDTNHLEIISGKHYFTFELYSKWSFFSNLFKMGCCSCSRANDEEFVVNFDKENNENSNLNLNSYGINEDDSYNDYIINMSKIYCDEDNKNCKVKEDSSIYN